MLGVVTKGYGNCKCRMLSIVVDFMILSDIYSFIFWGIGCHVPTPGLVKGMNLEIC